MQCSLSLPVKSPAGQPGQLLHACTAVAVSPSLPSVPGLTVPGPQAVMGLYVAHVLCVGKGAALARVRRAPRAVTTAQKGAASSSLLRLSRQRVPEQVPIRPVGCTVSVSPL